MMGKDGLMGRISQLARLSKVKRGERCRFFMIYNSWILDFRVCLPHLIVDLERLIMTPSFDNFYRT